MKNPFSSRQETPGVRPVSWEVFHGLCKGLALAVAKFDPDILIGIARGGLYPATMISQILRKEMYPVRLTRRVEEIVTYEHPRWLLKPPPTISGLRVLVVDEICRTGDTLTMVRDQAKDTGAIEVKTAVLYSRENTKNLPDYIGLVTDDLVLSPWDREILKDDKYIFHPEYVNELYKRNLEAKDSLLLDIKPEKLDKA